MTKINSGLYTQRLLKQDYLILISNAMGSVFGVISSKGLFVELVEDFFLNFCKNKAKTKVLSPIICSEKKLVVLTLETPIKNKESLVIKFSH